MVSAGTTWKGAKVQSKAEQGKKKEGILDIDPEYKIVIWKPPDMGATPFSEQDLFLNLNFFQRSYRLSY